MIQKLNGVLQRPNKVLQRLNKVIQRPNKVLQRPIEQVFFINRTYASLKVLVQELPILNVI